MILLVVPMGMGNFLAAVLDQVQRPGSIWKPDEAMPWYAEAASQQGFRIACVLVFI